MSRDIKRIYISVKGLRLRAHHGVDPSERLIGNDFTVDITVRLLPTPALESDALSDTVSYADLVDIAKQVMASPSMLLENVAWRMQQTITRRFPDIQGGKIVITKLLPPLPCTQLQGASVAVEW